VHDQALGLVEHDDLVVLVDDVERDAAPSAYAGSGAGIAIATASPALTRWPGSRIVRPPRLTSPARISALMRVRTARRCGGEHAVKAVAGLRVGGNDSSRAG
jgi:hypothetical protein